MIEIPSVVVMVASFLEVGAIAATVGIFAGLIVCAILEGGNHESTPDS